jgi:hypothetical protein
MVLMHPDEFDVPSVALAGSSGKQGAASELAAIEALIFESVRFAFWAAGEGICPVDGEDARAPEDFFMAYTEATGDVDWDTLADRVRKAIAVKFDAA